MTTVEEILAGIQWKDASTTGTSLGTIQDLFPKAELLLVKTSKSGAKRATIMVKDGDKVTNLIIGEELTVLVREGLISLEHLVGFPLMHNDKQNQLYVGRPSQGWQEVKSIVKQDYKITAITMKDLEDA
jgi:hypothetical protein